jgi:hypothetical protein
MSRIKTTNDANNGFVERFIEVCGTSQASKVQHLLNISYQAAKNYLNGRLPESKVLQIIAEKTPYSVHWLLTGKGAKLIAGGNTEQSRSLDELSKETSLELENLIKRLIHQELLKLTNLIEKPIADAIPASGEIELPIAAERETTITLKAKNIRQEKILEPKHTLSYKK